MEKINNIIYSFKLNLIMFIVFNVIFPMLMRAFRDNHILHKRLFYTNLSIIGIYVFIHIVVFIVNRTK